MFLWLCLNCGLQAAPDAPPVITTILEFYHLPEKEFARGVDIRIKANVTFADDDWHQLYVQDANAGLYLDTQGLSIPSPLPAVVLLEGVSSLTNGFRRIQNLRVQPLSESAIPLIRYADAVDLYHQTNGSCLVRVRGVVKSYVEEDRLTLRLEVGGTPFVAFIRDYRPADVEGLLGARIRLEAVCCQDYDSEGHLSRVRLLAGGRRDFQIEEPGIRAPFDASPVDIADLKGTNAATSRVQVHGIVTAWEPGQWVEVFDGMASIRPLVPFIAVNPVGREYEFFGTVEKKASAYYLDEVVTRELVNVGQTNPLPPPSLLPNAMTRIGEIRNLSKQEAARNLPVRVKGYVTFHDDGWKNIFISDGTNGIYVEGDVSGLMKPGLWLDVAGVTMPGDGYTYIARAGLRVMGSRQLPPPLVLTYDAGSTGTNDSQWCQISGIVREVREHEDRYYVEVGADDGGVFSCWLAHVNDTNFLKTLVNVPVAVSGVCANQVSKSGHLSGFVLRVHDESFITRQGSSLELERAIADINRNFPGRFGNALCRVRGVVTLVDPVSFYIQDKTGGIRAVPASFAQIPKVGDRVEVTGKRGMLDYTPFLEGVSVSITELPYLIKPKTLRGQNLVSGENEGELVSIKAQALERVPAGGKLRFFAQDGNLIFQVVGSFPESKLPEIKAGSIVSLTGVCAVSRANTVEVKSCRLLLRSPEDIQVVWRPPEGWDWERFFWALGLLSLVLLAGLCWVLLLRRQVRLQTKQISDRLERESALEARLLQSQKMESIGQLAAGVAHDFNNLLTVIEGYAAMLAGDSALSKEGRISVNAIVHASHRAAELTQQLLAFSRQQPMKLQVLDVNEVLESVSKLFSRLLTESITLSTVLAPSLPQVRGDSGMIQQVMMNLLVNARDAMPNGGLLEIRTDLAEFPDDETALPGRAGQFIRVSVRDTGMGMSPEVMRRIFEPFFTTKEVGKGTGLGLATVHGIVQQHGGWVDVSSEIGKGTVFQVYFPVHKTKPAPAVPEDFPPS